MKRPRFFQIILVLKMGKSVPQQNFHMRRINGGLRTWFPTNAEKTETGIKSLAPNPKEESVEG